MEKSKEWISQKENTLKKKKNKYNVEREWSTENYIQ